MDDNQKDWILAVRREVDKSSFEPDHKSALQRQLNSASKLLNGTTDKMAIMFECTAEKIVRDVRQELKVKEERKKQIDERIAEHMSMCKAQRRPGIWGFVDKMYDQSPILTMVLIIWAFQSGYVGQLLKLIEKL